MKETIDGYDLLCNAIVLQAVEDYKFNPKIKKRLEKKLAEVNQALAEALLQGNNELIARAEKERKKLEEKIEKIDIDQKDIEKFFRSSWYQFLTKVDGAVILDYLHKVVSQ